MSTAPVQKFVGYARVSTKGQGTSGLGLEAQEGAIRQYVDQRGGTLAMPIWVEVESGRKNDRPILAQAIAQARLLNAVLLVAKLDRLARNASFLGRLKDAKVKVVFLDMPSLGDGGAVDGFILHVMAGVAELEAGLIGERTKAALQAAKARGRKLGGFRGVKVDPTLGTKAIREKADDHAKLVLPTIQHLQASGVTSQHGLARELTKVGATAPRGGTTWTQSMVARVLKRAEQLDM